MARVTFRYSDGRTKQMAARYANILQKLQHGTYETRDMRAAEVVPPKEIKDAPKEAVASKQIEAESPKKSTRTKSQKAQDQ